MNAFLFWLRSLVNRVEAHVLAFLRGPGGAILRAAAVNAVRTAGAIGAGVVYEMAAREVAGRPQLSEQEWADVAATLRRAAITSGINTSVQLLDAAIGAAVGAAPLPGAPSDSPIS